MLNTDPVGIQAELHVRKDCVSVEFVLAMIRYVGVSGLRFLFYASPEKISGGDIFAVRAQ